MNDKEELAQSSPEINPVLIMKFEKKDEFNAHFWKLGHFILQVRNNLMTLLIICTLFSNLLRLSVNTYRISNSTPNSAQSSKVLTHTNSLLSPLHAYTVSHSHDFFLVRWLSCFVFISSTRHPQRSPPTQCEITSQFSQNRKKKQILRIRKKAALVMFWWPCVSAKCTRDSWICALDSGRRQTAGIWGESLFPWAGKRVSGPRRSRSGSDSPKTP